MIDRRHFLGGGAAALALFRPLTAWATDGLEVALINATVWTGRGLPTPGAVGLIGERIALVGAGAVKAAITKRTRVVDLKGAFLMPAFADNHTHFLIGSDKLGQADLLSATSREDFAGRIAAWSRANPGKWVLGGSWDEQRLGGELPTRAWIDAATGDTPVAVPRTDLHTYLLNSAALKLAGITRDTPDPAGGVIVRDAKGEPTGIVKDNAKHLVERVFPPQTAEEAMASVRRGIAHALSKGIAQVHVPDINWGSFHAIRGLRAKGPTDIRFYCFVPIADREKLLDIIRAEGKGDDWVRWGGVKALADGSLGSRTAVFKQDYADAPGQRGVRVISLADLRRWIPECDKAGLHVATHAIGDLANDDVLDVYAAIERANGKRDRRFRIEHAQHVTPSSIPRFAQEKVIASVQPYHAIDDGRWAVKRIGDARLNGTYAFGSLMTSGARVTFGSDWPVAPIDPLLGLQAAVTRETIDGANPHGWLPDQKVSVAAALTAYTSANAYAGFMEDRVGLIAPGYYADLTCLDANPFTIDVERLKDMTVLKTFVGGKERSFA
ncbi:amidohydrolase family protein [Sphingomonadaceae bacterium jetA1]|jgi:predicted amidohydrolase YtcJ|uniref:amidohydrolase n=1 Tax=Facivitalis istanbulensis TaxID=3075838 RepID=UPI00347C065A